MKRETTVWLIVLLGVLCGMFYFYWNQPHAPLRDYIMTQRVAGFDDFLKLLRQIERASLEQDVVACLDGLPIQPKHLFVARCLSHPELGELSPMTIFREYLGDGEGGCYDRENFLKKMEEGDEAVCLAYYPPAVAKKPMVLYLLLNAGRLVDVEGGTVVDRDEMVTSREEEALTFKVFESWEALVERYSQFKRIRVGMRRDKKGIELQVHYQSEDGRLIQWSGPTSAPDGPSCGF